MTQKTRTKSSSRTGTASLEFDDFELHSTMQNFLQEEDQKKESGKGIWNFSTVAGLTMLFTGMMFVLSWIGMPLGEMSVFAQNAISALPFIGGALVTLVGFGFLVGDRRRVKAFERKIRRDMKSKQRAANKAPSNTRSGKRKGKKMDDIHGSEDVFGNSFNTLRNDLDSDSSSKSSTSSYTGFDSFASTSYGYKQSKKLMKSRSDKKFAGVCGGLAKYFGISSTVARLLFVIAFFMTSGTSLLIYIGLSLAMPKEPVELMDDFDF